ncbi:MAG TPA: winged helix-turn-helix transcriptional regulator, partial [bacterium]|nr:winged helix-turn-helix transcriptional regulator [bacterium]
VNETVNETVKLSKIQKEIIKEIKNNEEITYEELAEKLKKGRATIHRHIQDLIKKGTIKRVGSAKSGYWKINE